MSSLGTALARVPVTRRLLNRNTPKFPRHYGGANPPGPGSYLLSNNAYPSVCLWEQDDALPLDKEIDGEDRCRNLRVRARSYRLRGFGSVVLVGHTCENHGPVFSHCTVAPDPAALILSVGRAFSPPVPWDTACRRDAVDGMVRRVELMLVFALAYAFKADDGLFLPDGGIMAEFAARFEYSDDEPVTRDDGVSLFDPATW